MSVISIALLIILFFGLLVMTGGLYWYFSLVQSESEKER